MSFAANVPRFYVFTSLVYFNLWMPIWVVFFQQRGMSLTQIGTLDAVGWIVMALAEVPTGAVADTYGRKTSLALGALLNAAAVFAITAEVFSPVFLFGYMLWGTAHTLFSGADSAFLYDSLIAAGETADYARVAGRMMAFMQGSQAIASLVGAWLAGFDMTLCFTIAGAASLLAALVALTFREPPRHDRAGAPAARQGEPGPAPAEPANAGYLATIRAAVRIAASRPAVRYPILLAAIAPVFNFLFTFMLLQPYAAAVGLPTSALGVAVLLVRGASVLGSATAHRLLDRLGPRTVVAGAVAALILAHTVAAAAPSRAAIGLFAVSSMATAEMGPTLSTSINRRIPSAQRATVISLQSLLWTLSLAAIEPALFGVAGRAGVPFAVGVAGALLAVTAVPLLILWTRTPATEPRGAEAPPA